MVAASLLINSSLEYNFFIHLKAWSDHVREESKYTRPVFSHSYCRIDNRLTTYLHIQVLFSSFKFALWTKNRDLWFLRGNYRFIWGRPKRQCICTSLNINVEFSNRWWRVMKSGIVNIQNEWRLKGPDKILVVLRLALSKRQTVMIPWRLSVFCPWGTMETTVKCEM